MSNAAGDADGITLARPEIVTSRTVRQGMPMTVAEESAAPRFSRGYRAWLLTMLVVVSALNLSVCARPPSRTTAALTTM